MNLTDILLWLPLQLQNLVLALGEWGREHIRETIRALSRALFINVVVMAFGLILEVIGFRADWEWLLSFGHLLVAFAGALAAGLWLYVWIRIWVLAEAAVKTNEVATVAAREGTRPLPSSPVNLPQILDQPLADRILRGVMAGLAAVAFGSMYAGFFPVYTNAADLLVSITAGFFIAFVAHNPTTAASTMPRKWLAPIAVAVIIVNTLLCLFSYDAERFTILRGAEGRGEVATAKAERVLVNQLVTERNKLLTSIPKSGSKEEARVFEINQQIQDIRDGKYVGGVVYDAKTATRNIGSSVWGLKPPIPDLSGTDPVAFLFLGVGAGAIALILWMFFKRLGTA